MSGLELMMSCYSVAVSVNIVVSLSLLIGVKLEKRWLLMPWVAWNTLSLIISQMAIFVVPGKVETGDWRHARIMICFIAEPDHPRHFLHWTEHLLHHVRLLLLPGPQ